MQSTNQQSFDSEMHRLGPEEAYVVQVSVEDAVDKSTLLSPLARSLRFPDYYGENWDAFDDCIRDLDWIRQGRIVLAIKGLEQAAARLPADVELLRKILNSAVAFHSQSEKQLDVRILM